LISADAKYHTTSNTETVDAVHDSTGLPGTAAEQPRPMEVAYGNRTGIDTSVTTVPACRSPFDWFQLKAGLVPGISTSVSIGIV